MEKARQQFEDLAKKIDELGLSPETLSSLPSYHKLCTIIPSTPHHHPVQRPRWHKLLACTLMFGIVVVIAALIPFIFMIMYEIKLLPDRPWIQGLHKELTYVWLEDVMQLDIEDEECIVNNLEEIQDMFRPPVNCSVCANVTQVDRVEKLSSDDFVKYYAYSGHPVVITDATVNWTANSHFTFNFFKSIYDKESPVLDGEDENCQFFPYKTKFENLGEVFQMSASRSMLTDGSDPWYIGWSNCDSTAANILRQYYQRPYFLPSNSESSKTDWIFMGSPGYGAPLHIDDVEFASWQAQIKGTKKWLLEPPPECYLQCQSLEVTVYPGKLVIVLDTNKWFHATLILGEELSVVIGSEYD
ncbi:bifunctional arginine demethylase and lysyl-hydroxylase PSR-like [Amphiura filiformis]|uniref:bifunctional arginine demethylase and lysyl-hydroxylase PSR-like n=1 Tax=Amphiura filiformis TaxID=82378 RepID=UPI003B21941A